MMQPERNGRGGNPMGKVPEKPGLMDHVVARRSTGNTRRLDRGGGGGLPQSQDPNRDLDHLPDDVRAVVKNHMGIIHDDGSDVSVRVYEVVGADGKKRTIIDL